MNKFPGKIFWAAYFWAVLLLLGILLSPGITPNFTTKTPEVRSAPFELTSPPAFPVATTNPDLAVSARSFVAMDVASGQILFGKNESLQLPPASTAKLMLVWLVRKTCPLSQVVTVKSKFDVGTVLGLVPGQQFTVGNLLYPALLPSDNDAAMALAEGCLGSISAAVQAMNDRAGNWHLKNTHFANPTGLDQDGNFSSAADLAHLASLVTKDPVLASIVATKEKTITDLSGQSYHLKSTNELLGLFGVDGIKTGQTELAGENLIASATLGTHRVITVVLGSSERFIDTLSLLAEIRRVYSWEVEGNWDLPATLGASKTGN